jgi:hypothetical protein
MKKILCSFGALIVLVMPFGALSSDKGPKVFHSSCKEQYKGVHGNLSAEDAKFLAHALALIKGKKRAELLAITVPKLLLVRRYVSGGVDSRGGNLWIEAGHKQIDKNLDVHIPPMKLPEYLDSGTDAMISQPAQTMELSPENYLPETDGTAITLNRTACGDDKKCELLPFGPDFEEMVTGLMHCTANRKSAFLFKDGLLITGMDLIPWPIGFAYFFTKTPSGYKLAALIDFE